MLNLPGYQLKWVRSPHGLVVYNVASSVRGPGYGSRSSRRDVAWSHSYPNHPGSYTLQLDLDFFSEITDIKRRSPLYMQKGSRFSK